MSTNESSKNHDKPEEQPAPVGRPLLFKTAEDLEMAIQTYFDMCDPHIEERMVKTGSNQKDETIWGKRKVMTEQKPYVLSGLARALGVDRKTLLNYSNRAEYFPTVEAARIRCEEYAESQLFVGNSNGAKFNLTNNYENWVDKQAVDHTTKGERMNPYGELTADELRKLAKAE